MVLMPIEQWNTGPFRLLCTLWLLGIATLSLLPAEVAVTTGWSDKIEHGLAFAILVILARLAWPDTTSFKIVSYCIAYGAFIELAQTLSPGRYPDLWDLVADSIGAGIGILAILGWKRVAIRTRNLP